MKFQQIAVLGAGTMGIGIAEVAAAHGHQVKLYDISNEAATEALASLTKRLDARIHKGKISKEVKQSLLNNIQAVNDLTSLQGSELIIEAVVERLDIKQQLFTDLEKICGPSTLLASNTSSISITAIATPLAHPERVLGLHFFNPAPVMKLVEVIAGLKTDPQILKVAKQLIEDWGKVAVHAQSSPGFIVNRVARPFYGEALKVKQEQLADVALIDASLTAAGGFRMGPFALMDLIGIDINFQVSQTVYQAMFQDPRYRPSLIQSEMVAAGLLGRKSGQGFYHYPSTEADNVSVYAKQQNEFTATVQLAASSHPFEQMFKACREFCEVKQGAVNKVGDTALFKTAGHRAQDIEDKIDGPVCLIDWSFDYAQATAVTVTFSGSVSEFDQHQIIALFQQLKKQVIICPDSPGMINARIMAMLINEAADALFNGIASFKDIDLAMHYGTNYPQGLLQLASHIGWQNPATVLTELHHWFGDDRYRLSPYIRNQL